MDSSHQLFTSKLHEMIKQYVKARERINVCGEGSHFQVHEELKKAKEEYQQRDKKLRKYIAGSRSPAVATLAQMQLENNEKMEQLMKNGQLMYLLHSEESSLIENRTEAAALYAEYAIDSAGQAMQYALIAALSAMDLQLQASEGGTS